MDGCPKDEPRAKNLVCRKTSSHSREKLEKPVGIYPPGHQRVKEKLIDCKIYYGKMNLSFIGISTGTKMKIIKVLYVIFLRCNEKQSVKAKQMTTGCYKGCLSWHILSDPLCTHFFDSKMQSIHILLWSQIFCNIFTRQFLTMQ